MRTFIICFYDQRFALTVKSDSGKRRPVIAEMFKSGYNDIGRRDMNKPLPIGIDDFKKLRDYDSFYVDKTSLIKELCRQYAAEL